MGCATRATAPPGAVTGWNLPWRRHRPLGRARAWVGERARELLAERAEPPAEALAALFEVRPAVWLRRIPGRETFPWPDADGPAVAKRYLGEEAREAWAELLRLRTPRSPGRRECENLLALAADGLPVPRALAWWEEPNPGAGPGHRFGRSAVLMERVPHTASLRDACRLDAQAAARAWLRPLADLVARLHERGWYHRDLYLQHVVLAADGQAGLQLVLLDVGRARRERRPRRRWFVKDLAALLHSTPEAVSARARLRFLALYARSSGLDRARRRALARDVLAKARRIAAHAPRHVDPDDALRAGAGR